MKLSTEGILNERDEGSVAEDITKQLDTELRLDEP
jgi:hypothetical protein